jgi:hypothetical protein
MVVDGPLQAGVLRLPAGQVAERVLGRVGERRAADARERGRRDAAGLVDDAVVGARGHGEDIRSPADVVEVDLLKVREVARPHVVGQRLRVEAARLGRLRVGQVRRLQLVGGHGVHCAYGRHRVRRLLGVGERGHKRSRLALGGRAHWGPNAVKNGSRFARLQVRIARGRERNQRALAAIVELRDNVQRSAFRKISLRRRVGVVVVTNLMWVLQLGDAISGRHRHAKPLMIPARGPLFQAW